MSALFQFIHSGDAMNINEVFQILNIEKTKDERAIKNAYRDKLAVTNPEDDAEGFKRLRTAYEEACRYAKSDGEDADRAENEGEKRDETPSGQWLEKAKTIYGNIITRRDTEKWKELFDDDIFLSLEEEENCRVKLIAFLMANYRLPTAVWKLLDSRLDIVSKAAQLREKFPADFVRYIVTKCSRGEDVEFERFEGEPEAEYDQYLHYYDLCWEAIQNKNYDQAQEALDHADALQIFHPAMGVCRAHLLAARGQTEEAVEYIRELWEKTPDDSMVAYNAAEIMWNNGRKTEAVEIYQSLKASNDKHYMANYRLTEWHYDQKEYDEAKKCAEKVLSSGADDSFMELLKKINAELEQELQRKYSEEKDILSGLELGWCYLQDGMTTKGIRIAEDIFDKVPEDRDSEVKGLLTKLYTEAFEMEEALSSAGKWAEALNKRLASDEPEEEKEKDRDRLRQYHLICMQCHKTFGEANLYRERCSSGAEAEEYHRKAIENYHNAIAEGEKLMSETGDDIGVLLELARMYKDMQEYDKSLDISKRLIEEFQVYAAYANMLEVYRKQWDAGGVVQNARQCIYYFPAYARAYEHAAKVYLDLKRNDDLAAILDEAEKNGVKSVILDAYRYQMEHTVPGTDQFDKLLSQYKQSFLNRISAGQTELFEEAERTITEYLYDYPGVYMLNERGYFYKEAHHYEEAVKDFEKSLEENPYYPYAYHNMAFSYKYLGNFEKAVVCFQKAITYKEPGMSNLIYFDIANMYSILGEYKRALKYYREYVYGKNGNKNFYYVTHLAECMARCGQVDNAVQTVLVQNGVSLSDRYDFMEYLYQQNGREKEAYELLKKWADAIGIETSVWKGLMPKKKYQNMNENDHAAYYYRKAWYELLYGNGGQALKDFDKLIEADKQAEGKQCDAAFAAILYGDERRGKKYARMLKNYLDGERSRADKPYYNRRKGHVMLEVLSIWYDDRDEEIERLLRESHDMEICHFCTHCICKELEGLEVLYLLKKGRAEEAEARIERNLSAFPFDEYMIAVRRMIKKENRSETRIRG